MIKIYMIHGKRTNHPIIAWIVLLEVNATETLFPLTIIGVLSYQIRQFASLHAPLDFAAQARRHHARTTRLAQRGGRESFAVNARLGTRRVFSVMIVLRNLGKFVIWVRLLLCPSSLAFFTPQFLLSSLVSWVSSKFLMHLGSSKEMILIW